MRAALVLLALLAPMAHAQDIPRTAGGKPDFHGLWLAESVTPMERPDDLKSLVIAPDQAADALKKLKQDPGKVYDPEFDTYNSDKILTVNGELRSSWIVMPTDGKLPLTKLANAAMGFKRPMFDNPEERDIAERCLDGLAYAPIRAVGVVIPYLFVQTPDALVIATEDMNPARIVDLAGRPHPSVIKARSGDSNGRWEGDTLVIETDNFTATDPRGLLFRDVAPVSEGSRIVERMRLISPDEILYQFTIEDPALYSGPWLAELTIHRTKDVFLEYACHEGNSSMASILTAARMGRQKPDKEDDNEEKKAEDKDD
jgi:hypothetical protein